MKKIPIRSPLSSPRKRGSIKNAVRRDIFLRWIPAFAGMTSSLLLVAGCAVGPDYHKPEASLPAHWLAPGKPDAQAEIEQDWWKHFGDPTLDTLISQALTGNYDLKIAETRIGQARAERAVAVGSLLPSGNLKATDTREANQIAFPVSLPGVNIAQPFNIYQGGFDASWELDLFGGNRRALESATAELKATEASRDEARVSLLAEVARTYMDIRRYQAQLAIAADTVKAQQKTLSITQEMVRSGTVAGIDASQAKAQELQAETEIPEYRNKIAQAEYAMDVLLGKQPGFTHPLVANVQPIPQGPSTVILAAPAKVIANRPDIRMNERKLAAATADQGVATAQFFPDISVSGFLGLLSTDSGHLFMNKSKSWLAAGSVTWPILNFSKLTANLDTANARQQEAFLTYQRSIIAALSDVERAATALERDEEHRDLLRKTEAENRHVAEVAEMRYKAGLTSFLDVLDAQRTLYTSQTQTADAEAIASEDVVALYKSLGGGWKGGKE